MLHLTGKLTAAARTEAASLAAERPQVLGMATIATHLQEAILESTALEMFFELPLDILGQALALRCQMLLGRRAVFLNVTACRERRIGDAADFVPRPQPAKEILCWGPAYEYLYTIIRHAWARNKNTSHL